MPRGVLQFTCPKNDVIETKCGQIYKTFNVLKSFWVAFGHFFPNKKLEGVFITEGAFNRINIVYVLYYKAVNN